MAAGGDHIGQVAFIDRKHDTGMGPIPPVDHAEPSGMKHGTGKPEGTTGAALMAMAAPPRQTFLHISGPQPDQPEAAPFAAQMQGEHRMAPAPSPATQGNPDAPAPAELTRGLVRFFKICH